MTDGLVQLSDQTCEGLDAVGEIAQFHAELRRLPAENSDLGLLFVVHFVEGTASEIEAQVALCETSDLTA